MPVIFGGLVLTGSCAAVTTSVCALVAGAEAPAALDALTATRSVALTSASTTA
jgi:hypothetical protein